MRDYKKLSQNLKHCTAKYVDEEDGVGSVRAEGDGREREYDVVGAGRRYTPVSESHMYCERRQLTI